MAKTVKVPEKRKVGRPPKPVEKPKRGRPPKTEPSRAPARGGARLTAVGRELLYDLIAAGRTNREIVAELHKAKYLHAEDSISSQQFSTYRHSPEVAPRVEILMQESRQACRASVSMVLANNIRVHQAVVGKLLTEDGLLSSGLSAPEIAAYNALFSNSGNAIIKLFGPAFVEEMQGGRRDAEAPRSEQEVANAMMLRMQQIFARQLDAFVDDVESGAPIPAPRTLLIGAPSGS